MLSLYSAQGGFTVSHFILSQGGHVFDNFFFFLQVKVKYLKKKFVV